MSQDRTNTYGLGQSVRYPQLHVPAFVPTAQTQVVALAEVENKLKQLYSLQIAQVQVLASEVFKYLDKMSENFPSQQEKISQMRELILRSVNLPENIDKNSLACLNTTGTELSDYIDSTQKLRTLYIVLGCLATTLAVAGVVTAYTLATTPAIIGGALALFVGYNLAVRLYHSEPVKADPKDGENYQAAFNSLTEFLTKKEPALPSYDQSQAQQYQQHRPSAYNPYV